MRSQKKNVAMLCLFYFLSYVAFVLPYGYMQTFLEYVGYDVVERGIILSGTAVVAIITQFLSVIYAISTKRIRSSLTSV